MLRTEEWTKDIEGMISTCMVDVHDGEVVRVTDAYAQEFEIPTNEAVARYVDREYGEYPYVVVSTRLEDAGWSRG
jgi:hypothetical protein